MGWKEDLQTIKQQNASIFKLLGVLNSQTALNSKRIEAMKVLLDEQIKNQSRSADRMADRMIEMAMVNRGDTKEAASHRRTLKESSSDGTDLWQDSPETQWPPPGHTEVRMP